MKTMPIENKFELISTSYNIGKVISEQTMQVHHGKHLAAYVQNLNAALPRTQWEGLSLEEVVAGAPEGGLLNNAGQVLNHNMYFEQFKSYDPSAETQSLHNDEIDAFLVAFAKQFCNPDELNQHNEAQIIDCGRLELEKRLKEAGLTLFGSGWAWLSLDRDGKFVITQEPNAGNPVRRGLYPIFTIDVWEHAYYLDYQNRRADYLTEIWKVIDLSVPAKRYFEALKAVVN